MTSRPPLDPMSSLWDVIALQLRFQRERAGLTGTQLGDSIGCVRSTVSRIESNALKLDPKQAALADEALKTGGLFAALIFHALREPDGQWRKEHRDIEASASTIRIFEAVVIPGLLQTPEYARALAIAGGATDEVVRAVVEERVERQAILTRADPPLLWAIMPRRFSSGRSGVPRSCGNSCSICSRPRTCSMSGFGWFRSRLGLIWG